jgi:hypothetical protein
MTSGAQEAVERMIEDGVPFDQIELYIETLVLPSDHLGALWLLAWAEATDQSTRRRVVAEVLAGGERGPALRNLPAASSPLHNSEPS